MQTTEVASQALTMLSSLATKLGMTAEQLIPYFVKQAYIESVKSWFFFGIGTTVLLRSIKKFLTTIAEANKAEDGDEFIAPMVVYAAGMAVGAILTLVGLSSVVTDGFAFLNPEYWALMKVISSFTR